MTAETLNKKLLEHFGSHVTGKPKYRVVWSTDQLEKRRIKAGEFVAEKEQAYDTVVEVRKYNYVLDRWILERLSFSNNPELTERITYEPIYVFQDKYSVPLPLNLEVAIIYAQVAENPPKRAQRTWKMDVADEEAEFQQQVKTYKNMLDERADSDLVSKLQLKEAVVVPKQETANE